VSAEGPVVDEEAFLAAYDPAAFPRPSLAVDVVLLTVVDGSLKVLVVRREAHPFAGTHTLPGGFVGVDEELEAACRRVLRAKTGLVDVFVEQLHTFGAVDRDPRMRIVSVAHVALVDAARAPTDGPGRWATVEVPDAGQPLAAGVGASLDDEPLRFGFDHAAIVAAALGRLRERLDSSAVGYQLLPETFTLRRLQEVHEILRGEPVNKDSFRRRLLATGQLQPTGVKERAVGHRPAELYRFTGPRAV
jgi:8-oxo-dGTP diphosphatase